MSASAVPGQTREVVSPLNGSWLLVSCDMTLADGRTIRPYGAQPTGIILYNADGWMTCQMASGGDGNMGLEGASAYHGRFSVDEARAIVTHHVVWSSTSSVSGDAVRQFLIEGDKLTLTAAAENANVVVCWRRA